MGKAFFDLTSEQGVLRLSIAVTLFIALIGIAFGLASGSFSIVFDGVYSLVDASMSGLSLVVVKLITSHARAERMSRKLRERFTMGFWHLEPMVLALNGILLTGVALYALINAASSLLEGGRDLEFGVALVYAVVTVSACLAIAIAEARANRKIGSDFVRMDVKGWVMSASITAALLVAFCVGYLVQGTQWAWISPYIDPAVLALVCLVIIPLPMSVVRQALSEMFLVTPSDLKQHVDDVAQTFVAQHGLQSYRAYVAKVGRSREIELYFIVPATMAARTIAEWDALRDEIGNAIGGEGPDRWLTVVFTGDPEWAE
ncbi:MULTISPECIES: cation diffusion facilitator family transporter [Pseudomonas]|uniref:Cation efflux family protein n=1 Tax=Pseudomonas putida TaxID=303 RepID=A0A1B2F9Q1_PSEPU|nr:MULTISPECIES: cation transporter [Pseudomonas]ANY88913.1 Cation efflux family protein [Pseudomonas putida]MCL8305715.1 cation transporter [Pseudomonas putida]